MLSEIAGNPNQSSMQRLIEEFLLSKCYYELEGIMAATETDRHYGLPVDLMEMFLMNEGLADDLIVRPDKYEKDFNGAIANAQIHIKNQDSNGYLTIKKNVHPRFYRLPLSPWTMFDRIPKAESLNRLICVRGTVVRTGAIKVMERGREFECGRCKKKLFMDADDLAFGAVGKPSLCDGSVDDLPCKSTKFTLVEESDEAVICDDYQEIKIQELTSNLEIGAVPRSLVVLLRNDLVDLCKAGDDVLVTGCLKGRCKNLKPGAKSLLEFFLRASSVELSNAVEEGLDDNDDRDQRIFYDQFWSKYKSKGETITGRDLIVSSFCPQIYGMYLVKLAVLLTVIGGSANVDEEEEGANAKMKGASARKSRREGHLLLVGDPGTAKSQFLVNSARLCSRSVMTTGSGSTSAGLTVAAVKDGGDWQLEAGALVMADKGICCIDEFNALREQDRTAIHEAMEQQTLSVAKAGLVCKLNTRCSIIAACNAKGKYEEGQPISANVALASPLLSRFDLIFVLLDRRKEEWDRQLCDRILMNAVQEESTWSFEMLRGYVNFCRSSLHPIMTPVAEAVLSKYYQLQRKADNREAARTTIRLLESLIRLSQAHAKLMHQMSVGLADALMAIVLMEASLPTISVLLEGQLDLYAEASENADEHFEHLKAILLRKLEINPRLYEEESVESMESDMIREMAGMVETPMGEMSCNNQRESLTSWHSTQFQ